MNGFSWTLSIFGKCRSSVNMYVVPGRSMWHTRKAYVAYASGTFNLGTRLRRVVSFTPRLIYPRTHWIAAVLYIIAHGAVSELFIKTKRVKVSTAVRCFSTAPCGHGKKPSSYVRYEKFLGQVSHYQIIKIQISRNQIIIYWSLLLLLLLLVVVVVVVIVVVVVVVVLLL